MCWSSRMIAHRRCAPALMNNLAIAYSKNGNVDEAIAVLRKIIQAEPNSALAHANLASAYTQQNRFREAADEYHEAVRLDPSNDVARLSLVKALVTVAQFSEAAPVAEDYVKRNPNDGEGLVLLGAIDRGTGAYTEAEAPREAAVPPLAEVYDAGYSRGFVLARLGGPQEALV